jgi:hypothetical protein
MAVQGSYAWIDRYNDERCANNSFFLEYITRPQTAEIFFEVFNGLCFYVPNLIENNKTDSYCTLETGV